MVPASLMVAPQKTDASLDFFGGAAIGMAACFAGDFIAEAIGAAVDFTVDAFGLGGLLDGGGAMVPVDPIPTEMRECTLDVLFWNFANELIRQILRDMTAWVEGGFEGFPAFLTNPREFFEGVARSSLDRFISDNLAFLCEPFRFNIEISLTETLRRTRPERYACTLDDVFANYEGFVQGNFMEGGWRGWIHTSRKRANNPAHVLVDTTLHLPGVISVNTDTSWDILTWGRGLFSTQDEEGNVITPGAIIEDQLNNHLDTGRERLVVAKEVNELLDALLTFFITELFDAGTNTYSGLIGGVSGGVRTGSFAVARTLEMNDPSAAQERLLASIDARIAAAEEREDEVSAEALRALRAEVEAVDPTDPDAASQLTALENALRFTGVAEAAVAASSGAGGGAVGDIGTLPPYDNPGIAEEPASP